MMRQLAIVGTAWLAALSCAWPGLAAGFYVIPDVEPGVAVSLYDVSFDGTVVAGRSMIAGGLALRWTHDEGNEVLGDLIDPPIRSAALAVSRNGQYIVGAGKGVSGGSLDDEGFVWTESSGMVSIGNLAPTSPGRFHFLQALGVSDEGETIVGFVDLDDRREAFRWTAQSGMVGLGDLPGGSQESLANDVSADGSFVVGSARSARGAEAAYWTQSTGFVALPDLPGANPEQPADRAASAVTADGSVIVGMTNGPNGSEAFRWTSETGVVGLGDLPGGSFFSNALDVSDNGNIVVGWSTESSVLGDLDDFIWDPVRGMRSLVDVLVNDYGYVDVLEHIGHNKAHLEVRAISGDGGTLIGPNWIADLHGDFLPGDTNFDGAVDLADFGTLKANFGTGQYRNQGDFSADGRVDLADFGLLKQNFGTAQAAVPVPSGGTLAVFALMAVSALARIGERRQRSLGRCA